MSILGYIITFTIIGSILSLIGGVLLLWREKFALKISHYLSSFAAGALLGTAFLDLLPEGLEYAEELGTEINIFWWAILGFLTFFLLERLIHLHHHYGHSKNHQQQDEQLSKKSLVSLIVLGDGAHNFIDGVMIAATFMVSVPLGIATAIAVAAHEIPQEIGDFGIMLHKGVKRAKVLWLNILSAVTALIGAILTYLIGESIQQFMPMLLSLAAGFFIYIAASDLIPEIHKEEKNKVAMLESAILILGVLVVWLGIKLLEG